VGVAGLEPVTAALEQAGIPYTFNRSGETGPLLPRPGWPCQRVRSDGRRLTLWRARRRAPAREGPRSWRAAWWGACREPWPRAERPGVSVQGILEARLWRAP
jgi:hypothetical protein